MCWSAGDRMVQPGGVLSSYYHRVFQQWVGSCRLRTGRPGRFLPRLQPSMGGASAHEAGGGGRRCERANDRVRLVERLDRDARLGVARRPDRASLSPVSTTPRSGFETAIATTAAGPFYEVKALDAGGKVLNTSAVIRVHG